MSRAVFILTFGRPNKVATYRTLRKLNYTGKIFLICSDDDKELGEYKKRFGEEVIVFNKEQARLETDTDRMDNLQKTNMVLYARNYCFKIAEKLGLDNFLVLDDDYSEFRGADFIREWKHAGYCHELDTIFDACFDFYNSVPSLLGFSLSQTGDFIGGVTPDKQRVKRKCMNSFFCKTDRPYKFLGTINEDTNFYVSNWANTRGWCAQLHNFSLNQLDTQKNSGGLTDIYLDIGTYCKSFYSVMLQPVAVKVAPMGDNHIRLHHKVAYNKICPKIIRQEHKKR